MDGCIAPGAKCHITQAFGLDLRELIIINWGRGGRSGRFMVRVYPLPWS